ncbi:pentapeptide repeat-containing protein, partial [Serratia marcescens]
MYKYLSVMDLTGADLSGMDLCKASLSGDLV